VMLCSPHVEPSTRRGSWYEQIKQRTVFQREADLGWASSARNKMFFWHVEKRKGVYRPKTMLREGKGSLNHNFLNLGPAEKCDDTAARAF